MTKNLSVKEMRSMDLGLLEDVADIAEDKGWDLGDRAEECRGTAMDIAALARDLKASLVARERETLTSAAAILRRQRGVSIKQSNAAFAEMHRIRKFVAKEERA